MCEQRFLRLHSLSPAVGGGLLLPVCVPSVWCETCGDPGLLLSSACPLPIRPCTQPLEMGGLLLLCVQMHTMGLRSCGRLPGDTQLVVLRSGFQPSCSGARTQLLLVVVVLFSCSSCPLFVTPWSAAPLVPPSFTVSRSFLSHVH